MNMIDVFAAHAPPPKDKNATADEVADWNYECAEAMLRRRKK